MHLYSLSLSCKDRWTDKEFLPILTCPGRAGPGRILGGILSVTDAQASKLHINIRNIRTSALTALTTPTPLNRQSRNIAHVITSIISPHATFGQDRPSGTSPHIAKVTTQFF